MWLDALVAIVCPTTPSHTKLLGTKGYWWSRLGHLYTLEETVVYYSRHVGGRVKINHLHVMSCYYGIPCMDDSLLVTKIAQIELDEAIITVLLYHASLRQTWELLYHAHEGFGYFHVVWCVYRRTLSTLCTIGVALEIVLTQDWEEICLWVHTRQQVCQEMKINLHGKALLFNMTSYSTMYI